jgi:hypothetical protein
MTTVNTALPPASDTKAPDANKALMHAGVWWGMFQREVKRATEGRKHDVALVTAHLIAAIGRVEMALKGE